tara:strand:- start:2218 stop:2526 length:309 start_codon:yes stop_codon:yes gene_type:complete
MRDGEDYAPMSGIWSQYIDLLEINAAPAEPWYLNIPEGGVECYVSYVDPNPCLTLNNMKRLVTGYKHGSSMPFYGRGPIEGWKYATPRWKYATPINSGEVTL